MAWDAEAGVGKKKKEFSGGDEHVESRSSGRAPLGWPKTKTGLEPGFPWQDRKWPDWKRKYPPICQTPTRPVCQIPGAICLRGQYGPRPYM